MTVKELIERLKEFPEDMEVLNYEYFDINDVYEDTYPSIPNDGCTKYVIVN